MNKNCYSIFICLSCSSSGKTGLGSGTGAEQVKVKQEPGTDSSYSCPSSSVKSERIKDAGRSACMVQICLFIHDKRVPLLLRGFLLMIS